MTAIFGGQEKLRVRRSEECNTCTGSGIKPGAKAKTCSACGGQVTNILYQVSIRRFLVLPFFSHTTDVL